MSRYKVFYIVIGIAAQFYGVCSGTGLTVTPDPSQLVTSVGDVINLLCKASERPSICLWKTPYQAIYTVGGGRIWEQGRLSSSPLAEGNQCGLVIAGIQPRDRGVWECEVGAVVDGEFTTTTARSTISIIDQAVDSSTSRLLGLEGDQITIPCLGNGKSGVCRWSSPYGQSYRLLPGDYAERGRILADDRCGLRISSLQRRDDGEWTCQVGDGRVSEKTTRVTIETPLKLSAPTSILQQADERATLVCHANKEYGRCEWETPYGRTVSFSKNNREAESGRLQYFGFSDMDCGIVIRDIGPRDSGGWTCRVSANIAGKEQISADIVRLFVEPTQYEDQREEPRSIQSSPPDYTIDYRDLDYNQDESKMDDYDAFDYVNGDFDKVVKGSDDYDQDTNNREIFSTSSKSPPRVVANPTLSVTSQTSTSKPEVLRTIEEDDGFIREIQKIGKFGTVRIDRIPDREHKTTTTSTTPFVAFRDEPRSIKGPPSTSPPISNTHQNFPVFTAVEEKVEERTTQSSLNPSELDFLELISGSRVDNRPFRIDNSSQFGIRQSSVSGSRFQFGDIHLVENGGKDDADHSRERGGTPREFITNDSKDENNIERPVGRQKVRIRTQVKSSTEKEKENEERARIAEEELNRERLRQIEERKQQRLLEEEDRRVKLRKLREQQIEESRKLQKERERKRLEAELAKKRQEEEEAARIAAEKREAEEKRQKELEEERERKIAIEKLQKEREKQLQEERERRLQAQIEKLKKEREEQRKLELEEIERKKILEEQKALEEERHRKVLEERERQLREERERRIKEERETKRKEEIARKRKEEKERKQKEERERTLKEEKERERKREEDKIRRQKEERERRIKEQEQKARLEEEIQKQHELDEKKKKEEAERKGEELKEIEERRKLERDRIRQELQDRRKKEEQDARRKKLLEDRQRRINEEKERKRQEEIRKIQEDNEKATKLQKEAERRLQIEKEKLIQEELENERKELEENKKKQEEEERLQKVQKAHDEKLRRERQRLREEADERRRKERQELEEIKKRDEERRKEIQLLKDLQAERDRSFQEEREKKRKEVEEEKKKKEEEEEMIRKREKARKEELDKLRSLQLERDRLLKEERERLREENLLLRQKEEEENEKLKQQATARKKEIENLRALQLEREGQLKEERERIRKQKQEIEKQQLELQRQQELLERIRKQKQATTTPKPPPTPAAKALKKCIINPWPESGNITCPDSPLARGQFIVKSGNKCHLNCKQGFVTLDAKETLCQNGQWSHKLYCVLPGAMLVVGGRSDTYGVLSSVELVTSGGVCRNIVPNLPTMRWKMVSASIDEETVVACGGINFLGDPKTDCWRLDFEFSKPRWTAMQSLSVPRDAAAWAAEQGKLFVMGGSLGTLSGYTASTEVYDPSKDEWVIGKSLTSTRASHCAVGDGAGHIIVTGGYGALQSVQRLDIKSGVWTNLPDLQPVRAQHGCAFVELMGKKGVIVVGGDSGGTRLNDVRFLSLDESAEWTKIADLNTARWGRPSVGTIGGKITVIGGWDGVKALNSVEFYNEKNQRWETSRRTKLSTERRWAASAQVSNKLFPTCVQKRS